MATLAVISIVTFTLTAGALRAADDAKPKMASYKLQLGVTLPDRGLATIIAVVLDEKGAVLMHPSVQTQRGVKASISDDNFTLEFSWGDHELTGTLRSRKDGALLTSKTYQLPAPSKSDGINLNLKDADIRDVAKTFAQLTGLQVVVDDGIEAKVTIDVMDMPWEQALGLCVKSAGLHMERHGGGIRITH